MKTYYSSYSVRASISDKPDGTARLLVKDPLGKKVHDKIHANRKAALTCWRRMCR